MSEVGTGYIIGVDVENVKGIALRDLDFKCEFYVYANRKVVFTKEDMVHIQKKNGDLYFALLDSSAVGSGRLMCRIVISDPVAQWTGGVRPVIIKKWTGKEIGAPSPAHQPPCAEDYDEGFLVRFNFVTGLPKADVGYIFYGHIVDQITDFGAITGDMLVDPQNHIIQVDAAEMGKTSCGVMEAGNKVVVLIPEDTSYVATKDNGIGGKVRFSEAVMGTNGGTTVTIGGTVYRVYGEMLTASGELFVYVD